MLPTNGSISSYLQSNSVQMLPHVSTEWNYNLIYQPYTTFAGDGSGISTSGLSNLSNWNSFSSSKVGLSIVAAPTGSATNLFPNPTPLKFTVSPSTDMTDPTNFQGSIATNIITNSNSSKCYKIVFLAQSIDSNLVNLVAQVTGSNQTLNGSQSVALDNLTWQTVEIKVGQRPNDPAYSNFNLMLDITNTTLSQTNPTSWGILIDQIRIYEITFFDYLYGSMWDTNSPFSAFRPGESYIRSGNALVSDSELSSSRVLKTVSAGGIVPSGWQIQAPCSPVTYSPRILFSAKSSPLFKNGLISPFSQYRYFVSEIPFSSDVVTSTSSGYNFSYNNPKATSIGAAYKELMSINKIVLKFNISQSTPKNIIVTLKNTLTNTFTTVPISNSDISAAGVCVLYWQGAGNGRGGSGWDTTKWNWTPSTFTSGMPFIDDNGNISMYLSGVSVDAYQNIDTISVTQTSSGAVINQAYSASSNEIQSELQRLQVIEISPRLEIDMSSFVTEFDVKKELDNKNTPLPISAMSANSGSVTFSNIPLSGNGGSPLSVFSTNSNAFVSMKNGKAITSTLSGLMVKNVKMYFNYYFPTLSNYIVPAGVHYVDSWDNQDISHTKANTFDIMKILQTLPVNDYVSQAQGITTVFSNIMDFSGFTDYNLDELIAALGDTNQKINLSFFYAEGASKTVYQVLQEAFLAYQIGAFIDEYGVMRFKNLNSIISSSTAVKSFSDYDIVADSYGENIKTKIGKVLMRYRGPQLKRNTDFGSSGSNLNDITSILKVAPDIIWQQDAEDLVPYNILKQSINNLSQNYFVVDQGSFTNLFMTNTVDHSGYYFLENEVISSGNMEFSLSAPGNASQTIYPSNSNELSAGLSAYANQVGLANISQVPTGRFVNINRGLFGTKASKHIVMNNVSDYQSNFKTLGMTVSTGSYSLANSVDPTISKNMIMVPASSNITTMVVAGSGINPAVDNSYSTYSVKFRFPTSVQNVAAGLFFNLNGTSTNPYFVEISTSLSSTSQIKYYLNFYYIDNTGTKKNMLNVPNGIDITGYINDDFNNEPIDDLYADTLGKFINLKFVRGGNNNTIIYVNKHRILLDRRSMQMQSNRISKTTEYIYNSYWLGDTSTSNSSTSSDFSSKNFAGTNFGFFTNCKNASTSVTLAEVYATESPIDEQVNYFFQTRKFLNAMVAGHNITERSFFVQSRPQLFGLNMYDVKMSLTPSMGAEMFKASYTLPYYPNNDTTIQTQFLSIPENSLSYSDIASTGFRAKFAIANASNYAVFTKTTPADTQLADNALLISSRGMVVLTPQMTLERVINPQLINEVIELQSDWVQSRDSADSILKVLAYSSDSFSKDITVSIFGNPLIQVGDVINLSYSLKNISNILFFVTAVDQNWSSNGLSTSLTLNQISYTGVSRNSLPNSYVKNTANLSAPVITSVSPVNATGPDIGGTSITINGSNFYSDATVYVGNNPAAITSSSGLGTAASTITITTPASNFDGIVDVSVLTNGQTAVYPASNAPFTYTPAGNGVQSILLLNAVPGTLTNGAYPVTLNWTISSTAGLQYNYFNLEIDGDDGSLQGFGDISDNQTGSHAYTTPGPDFFPGVTYTVTLTPIYINPSTGIRIAGTANVITFSNAGSTTVQPPSIISRSTVLIGFSGYAYYVTTFNLTQGAGSNSTYVFKDGIAGVNRVNGPTANYWTSTSIPVYIGADTLSHTVYFYGYDSTSASQSSSSSNITFSPSLEVGKGAVSGTGGSGGTGTGTGSLAAPLLLNPSYTAYSSTQATLSVNVVKDTSISQYVLYYGTSPTNMSVNTFPVSSLTFSGSPLVATITTPPVTDNQIYTVYAIGYNSVGTPTPQSNDLTISPLSAALPSIQQSISGTMDFSWTVPTGTYDTFFISYNGNPNVLITLPTITDSVTYTGSNWIFNSDGSTVPTSTSGGYITFTDTRHESYFIPNTIASFTIWGSLLGKPGSTSTISALVPGTTSTLVYPAAPGLYVTGLSPHVFNWIDDYLPSGTMIGYQVQLFAGINASGTPIVINGGTGYVVYGGVNAFFRAENTNGYTISTSHASPVYGRARAVFTFNGSTYVGPWGSAFY